MNKNTTQSGSFQRRKDRHLRWFETSKKGESLFPLIIWCLQQEGRRYAPREFRALGQCHFVQAPNLQQTDSDYL